MIDVIRDRIEADGVICSVITGSVNQRAREKIVTEFQSKKSKTQVILISIKAGGVGLNLTAANNVFIMEPWWNVAMEDQAVDRVHRIG